MSNPFDTGYFRSEELREFGFRSVGENVMIAKNSTIVGLGNIAIGDNVRIDSYCNIVAAGAGFLELGSYIHIAAYCLISASSGVRMADFSGLSHGVRVYSQTDDYTGEFLTNPTVPERYKGVKSGPVVFGRHVIVGSGSVILPNADIGEGASIGALSLVTKSLEAWGVYGGVPAKRLKARSKNMLRLEQELIGDASKHRAQVV